MREIKVVNRQFNSKSCFVCGLGNEFGLKARFYDSEGGEVVALFMAEDRHQSYPGRVHGGVISAILDETLGRAVCIGQDAFIWGVTMELTVKYKKPVPLNEELKVIGRITSDSRRIFEAQGELILPDGNVAATAHGRYMKMGISAISEGAEDFLQDEWGLEADEEIPEVINI